MTDTDRRDLRITEGIRKRPAMYVGSNDQFGLINYFVCPVALHLANKATHIRMTIGESIEMTSDAVVSVEEHDGRLIPFEEFREDPKGYEFEGTILTALSERLSVTLIRDGVQQELQYAKGVRLSHATSKCDEPDGTSLRFAPDPEFFRVLSVSSALIESYLRRLSYLHSSVTFSVTVAGQTQEFSRPRGIRDLFTAISSPYQIMHAPIEITAQEGHLQVELAMAYHSWSDDHLWCFINHGRAVEGGTHEKGLRNAFRRIRRRLKLSDRANNGVVAVASIRYPDAVWQGCIKSRIGNPELVTMVSQLVLDATMAWLKDHPEVVEEIRQMEIFQFPEVWYKGIK